MSKRSRKNRFRGTSISLWFIAPSAIGILIFYVIPFVVSFESTLIQNPVTRTFVRLQNFKDVLSNAAFQLALTNTVVFLLICIPLNIILPLCMALLLQTVKKYRNAFGVLFLLPLVIPSGSLVFFWDKTFGINGWINALFFRENPQSFLDSPFALAIVVFIFLWKNVGYNVVLFANGLQYIPKEYDEQASIEGANAWKRFRMVTCVFLTPTFFLVFMMSLVNSFKAFKDIYMLSGSYPHERIYMLQHYMYNQFSATNYQKLASSSYILTFGFIVIVLLMFQVQKKLGEQF